jgi:hypothetical protein
MCRSNSTKSIISRIWRRRSRCGLNRGRWRFGRGWRGGSGLALRSSRELWIDRIHHLSLNGIRDRRSHIGFGYGRICDRNRIIYDWHRIICCRTVSKCHVRSRVSNSVLESSPCTSGSQFCGVIAVDSGSPLLSIS